MGWSCGSGMWFFPFGLVFFILLIILAFKFLRFGRCHRRYGYPHDHDHHGHSDNALSILRRRLANGEIDEATYQSLKNALEK